MAKRFPFLSENKDYGLEDILSYAKNNKNKIKAYQNVAENEDIKIYLVSKGGKLNPVKLRLLINQPPPEVEEEEGGN